MILHFEAYTVHRTKNSNIGRHFNFTISPVSRVMFIVQYWINKSSWLLHSPLCDPTVGAKVYPVSKVYPPSEFFNFLSTPNKSCNFFHNKIQIGIVFDNEQKFHSSSMIFLLLKTPWIKSFFSQNKKFDRRRRRLTWDLKKLLKFGLIIEQQDVFFCRGLWGKFLKKSGSTGVETPPTLPKSVISISCVESISFLTLYPFLSPF